MFFRYFTEGERAYLARTWLLDEAQSTAKATKSGTTATKEPWNERDWYVNVGEEGGTRSWDDARRYGFVSAGGGEWFSRTLKKLPVGARIFVCIPGLGYVGVGKTTSTAVPFDEALVEVDGAPQRLAELPLSASYRSARGSTPQVWTEEDGSTPFVDADTGVDDLTEYVVPVRWSQTRSREEQVWEKGMFANQNSACKLRNRFTLERLVAAFGLDED